VHQHRDGDERDVGSEPGQQLGDGDNEAGETATGREAEKKVKIKKVKVSVIRIALCTPRLCGESGSDISPQRR
jgi:hypothetical protein